jgi:hypothetical protein
MRQVFLIVEGQCEEKYYKSSFASYFKESHYFQVTVMPLKKNQTSRRNKGGRISYDLCVQNIKRFMRTAAHCDKIVLIYDYYGLDASFSEGYDGAGRLTEIKAFIITKLEREIDNPKFSFFLQTHEFEAFLFANPVAIVNHFNQPEMLHEVETMITSFDANPELINTNHPPSYRLIEWFPEYQYGKTTDGVVLASNIGVDRIKERCSGFNEFVELIKKS